MIDSHWRVDLEQERRSAPQHYDVIIIGAGPAGLSCATRLSRRGVKVLLLEQYVEVGGTLGSFNRKGFIFNSGVEEVTGLWAEGALTTLLREAGLEASDYFVEQHGSAVLQHGTQQLQIPWRADGLIDAFTARFSTQAAAIRQFFTDADRAITEQYADVERFGVAIPDPLVAEVLQQSRATYLAERPTLARWMGATLAQCMDNYFNDPEIKQSIHLFFNYVGDSAASTPALPILRAFSFFLRGGYYTKGGGQRLCNALSEVICAHHGTLLTGQRVEKILVENGAVRGVQANNQQFYSPIVVSTTNARTTYCDLLADAAHHQPLRDQLQQLPLSESCCMLFLGLDIDLSGYPSMINDQDQDILIFFNSQSDPDCAPPGMGTITVIAPASYQHFAARGTPAYRQQKAAMRDDLLRKVAKHIPAIERHLVVKVAATPKTLERYLMLPEGAIEDFAADQEHPRPYFKLPIKGAYLAGSSVDPGSGIELAVTSGLIAANDIIGWQQIEQQGLPYYRHRSRT